MAKRLLMVTKAPGDKAPPGISADPLGAHLGYKNSLSDFSKRLLIGNLAVRGVVEPILKIRVLLTEVAK